MRLLLDAGVKSVTELLVDIDILFFVIFWIDSVPTTM